MLDWVSSLTRRGFLGIASGLLAKAWVLDRPSAVLSGNALTSEDILAAMRLSYACCQSYADSGCVSSRFLTLAGELQWVDQRPFSTAFIRPDRFRFEFKYQYPTCTEWERYIVSAQGEEVRTWWDSTPGIQRHESLAMALAEAAGVSNGSAYTIPSLLMPKQTASRQFAAQAEPGRLEDAKLGDVECYRVTHPLLINPSERARHRAEVLKLTGRDAGEVDTSPEVLWVEKTTFLLRRIEVKHRFATFATDTVIFYKPRMNVLITEEQLRFDPPTNRNSAVSTQ